VTFVHKGSPKTLSGTPLAGAAASSAAASASASASGSSEIAFALIKALCVARRAGRALRLFFGAGQLFKNMLAVFTDVF